MKLGQIDLMEEEDKSGRTASKQRSNRQTNKILYESGFRNGLSFISKRSPGHT